MNGQSSIDLGFFQDTKVMDGFHTRMLAVYRVLGTNAPIIHSRGVAVFYWDDASHFQAEAMYQHGPNMLSFQVVSRVMLWFTAGCYISPDKVNTIDSTITSVS